MGTTVQSQQCRRSAVILVTSAGTAPARLDAPATGNKATKLLVASVLRAPRLCHKARLIIQQQDHDWRFDLHQNRAVGREPLSNAPDQSQSDQEDNRADEGVDDRGNKAAADCDAELRQQPASDQTAENANDDVADQPVPTAFDQHTGKPTSDGTDDQPNDECLCVHLSPFSVHDLKQHERNRHIDRGQCALPRANSIDPANTAKMIRTPVAT